MSGGQWVALFCALSTCICDGWLCSADQWRLSDGCIAVRRQRLSYRQFQRVDTAAVRAVGRGLRDVSGDLCRTKRDRRHRRTWLPWAWHYRAIRAVRGAAPGPARVRTHSATRNRPPQVRDVTTGTGNERQDADVQRGRSTGIQRRNYISAPHCQLYVPTPLCVSVFHFLVIK